ncbi:YidC/Oxa1 family membrane protein insertase [Candidatus Gottesmanbacteria bacterium]|nr:YidC/Oxa1 family membrane protein insertase [Candidatus Gottesmanbacteria bacterium]
MTNPTFWNQFLIWPIVNLLVAFYKLFEWLHIPGPMGFAIILLTLAIRFLLYPIMNAQLKSAKKMAALKPHLDALSAKHKDDKTKLQQAHMALYKEHGVNPAAGCLPMLLQLPVLIALYNVFYQVLSNGNLEKIMTDVNQVVYHSALRISALDLTFFGVNLGIKPSQWQTHGWWLLAIPLITAVLQWYQTKLMTTSPPAGGSGQVPALVTKDEKKTDTAAEMQKQMALITPIMFGYFAFQFPVGLALYWNVFGLFGIIQQLLVNKEQSDK